MNTITRTRQVEPDVLNVLATADCMGSQLRLPGQLERKLYVRTNEVLEALGGQWDKKIKAHVFEGDAAEFVEQVLLTGTFSKTKQDFGFFETPTDLAVRVAALANIEPNMNVLEPSAGRGALASVLRSLGAAVFCVEMQERHYHTLKALGFSVTWGDFLATRPCAGYHRVVMNPPFAKRADIRHIVHAHKYLKRGGQLVAIASASVKFRQDGLAEEFRSFVARHRGTIEDLPEGSFKDSGTMVNTVLVTMGAA